MENFSTSIRTVSGGLRELDTGEFCNLNSACVSIRMIRTLRTVRTAHHKQLRYDKCTREGKRAVWTTVGWLEGNWNKILKWECSSVQVQLA